MKSNQQFSLSSQRAFTLVELLVVVAIIGILIGMLLPAVQQVREAARRTVCMNNISQLGLAIHNYEFAFERLPAGVTNNKGPIRTEEIGQHVGFLVELLPYIEQRGIAKNFDKSLGTYAKANRPARGQRIALFNCPSTIFSAPTAKGGVTNYAGCHHSSETQIDIDNNGLLFLNSRIALADIFDGASNTILLGEMLPTADSLGWASGTRASLRNPSVFLRHDDVVNQNLALPLPVTEVGGFGSEHPGSLNFCLADGASRSFSISMNKTVLMNLADREDGAMMGSFDW